jgi:hypothetical protein
MKISRTPAYKFYPAYELEVESPPFDKELLSRDENWEENKIAGGKIHFYDTTRKLLRRDGPNFQIWEWINKVVDKDLIYTELGKLWEDQFENFYKPWPYKQDKFETPEEFLRYWVSPLKQGFKDLPGYSMHSHYDNRAIFGNIFINMADNDCSTTFFDQGKPAWTAPTKKGSGIFFLNDENLYHTINHEGKEDRYILVVPITLKKMFDYNQ